MRYSHDGGNNSESSTSFSDRLCSFRSTTEVTGTLQCLDTKRTAPSTASDDIEMAQREYQTRYVTFTLSISLCLVPVLMVPTTTKVSLNHDDAPLTEQLASFVTLLVCSATVLSLLTAPFVMHRLSDSSTGMLTAVLSLCAILVVIADPHSKIALYVASCIGGSALGYIWIAPGVYIDNLLKHYPEVSLGGFGGILNFFLHLGVLASVLAANYSSGSERYYIGTGVGLLCGVSGLILQIRRPKWDGGDSCVAGEYCAENGDRHFVELWADLGKARFLVFTMIFHGVALQKLWVRLTQEMLRDLDDDDIVKAALPVASAVVAFAALIMGVTAKVSSPSLPVTFSTICGISASYIMYRTKDDWAFFLASALTGVGLAGYNVMVFCILILLTQRHSASPVTMFSCWGTMVALATAGASVYTQYVSKEVEVYVTAVLGFLSVVGVLVASYSMAEGKGWYRGIPRAPSIHFDEGSACTDSAIWRGGDPNEGLDVGADGYDDARRAGMVSPGDSQPGGQESMLWGRISRMYVLFFFSSKRFIVITKMSELRSLLRKMVEWESEINAKFFSKYQKKFYSH